MEERKKKRKKGAQGLTVRPLTSSRIPPEIRDPEAVFVGNVGQLTPQMFEKEFAFVDTSLTCGNSMRLKINPCAVFTGQEVMLEVVSEVETFLSDSPTHFL